MSLQTDKDTHIYILVINIFGFEFDLMPILVSDISNRGKVSHNDTRYNDTRQKAVAVNCSAAYNCYADLINARI